MMNGDADIRSQKGEGIYGIWRKSSRNKEKEKYIAGGISGEAECQPAGCFALGAE